MFGSTKIETGNSNKEVVKDGPLNLNDIGHSYGNSTDSPQAKVQLAQNVFLLSSPSAQTPRLGLEDGHEVFVNPFAGWHAGT